MLRIATLCAVAHASDEIVELSVASAATPFPQVVSAIKAAEGRREAAEASALDKLTNAYNSITAAAVSEINKIAHHGSFLKANIVEPTLDVKLVNDKSDEAAGAAAVSSIERTRQAAENSRYATAISELQELAKVCVAEFGKQLASRKAAFLSLGVPSLNVKVTSDPDFTTIASLGSDLESRRDTAERTIRARILDLQLRLVKTLNSAMVRALQ